MDKRSEAFGRIGKGLEHKYSRSNSFWYPHWRRQLWGTGARAPLDFQL